MAFASGQCWTYRAPEGFDHSRLVIGAIVTFDGGRAVICASVFGAPRQLSDGTLATVDIPFLPLTREAFAQTVLTQDGEAEPAAHFMEKLEGWSKDPRGLSVFTVPFEGFLDQLIARQMAEIMQRPAA